ncbi:MAG: AhpC/TSA family protein [Bacteroidales bacterium]|nr:AhpC/TSA family protein [Bacteroidales bacterium]
MKQHKIIISVFLISIFVGFSSFNLHAQKKKITLKGNVINYNSGDSIGLYDALGRTKEAIEKTIINKKGHFEFTHNPVEINFYTLQFPNAKNVLIVLSPNTPIEINIDAKTGVFTKVIGPKEIDLLQEYYAIMLKASIKKDSLMEAYKVNPDPSIQNELKLLDKEWVSKLKDLCLKNTSNFTSAFLIENLPQDQFLSIHDTVLSDLIKVYPEHFFIKAKYTELASRKKTAIGSIAPEISLPDTNGNIIPLSSLRGKIVLIDFWASWCGPCRRESPNMVKLYETYKDKGFEIYGVSLDQNKTNWISAIISDNLSWIHVSDLKRWQCQAGIDYSISSIPSTVLIDKDGKIIAKDLRGEALAAKVKEIFEKEE